MVDLWYGASPEELPEKQFSKSCYLLKDKKLHEVFFNSFFLTFNRFREILSA